MAKAKPSNEKEKTNYLALIRNFFEEVIDEAGKVVWPSRETLTQSSATVFASMVVLTFFMAIADFIWTKVIGLISI